MLKGIIINSLQLVMSLAHTQQSTVLSTKVPFIGDIWIATLILSFCVLVTYLYIYKLVLNKSENYFFITVLFLSPSSNFIIERMNIDVFIYLVGFICLINYKKYPKVNSFLLLIMALYKLHPLGFLLGLTLYFAIKMERKYFQINFNSVVLFLLFTLLMQLFTETFLPQSGDLQI